MDNVIDFNTTRSKTFHKLILKDLRVLSKLTNQYLKRIQNITLHCTKLNIPIKHSEGNTAITHHIFLLIKVKVKYTSMKYN